MTKIDISRHAIRVVLNRALYNCGSPESPLDVEGTALFIETESKYIIDMVAEGKILDILCNEDLYSDDTEVMVRWDNDVKHWHSTGVFSLRAAKISRCNNIWKDYTTISESHQPYHTFKPSTKLIEQEILYTEVYKPLSIKPSKSSKILHDALKFKKIPKPSKLTWQAFTDTSVSSSTSAEPSYTYYTTTY